MDSYVYEFFREATLQICSSLDIEKVMRRCIRYLKRYMPADQLFLNYHDQGLNIIRTIARATPDRCMCDDLFIQMPPDFDLMAGILEMPREQIVNRLEATGINVHMARAYGLEDSSLLQMFLETREQKTGLGHLTLCAKGRDRYNSRHLELFTLIKEPFTLAAANILQHARVLEVQQTLRDDNRFLQQELQHMAGDAVIGLDGGLREVMKKARRVAPKMSLVLLTGETGVGKDVFANTIHSLSKRSDGPFIKVNCGAIPDALIDSELFGHEKGAFTGAVERKRGRFERAHGGTIFLDEIGELPPGAQVRLLRVLQNREIERVGGSEVIEVDIRVIAATNRDLREQVERREFREDLWYRLNVFPIHIPPLRERKNDIAPLLDYFVKKKCVELQIPMVPRLASDAVERLMEYPWPGNVREFENVIERALILEEGGRLEIDPFPSKKDRLESGWEAGLVTDSLSLRIDDVTARHIEGVLEITGGKIHGPGGAAELLDINAGTLRNRMKKLGISYGRRRRTG